MLKTQRNRLLRIIPLAILIIGFINSIITDNITQNNFESLPFYIELQYKIITMPELYISMLILLVYAIIMLITSEKAEKICNKKVKLIIKVSDISVICIASVFVLLSSFTLITTESKEIPHLSDEKFLDIHDLGIADKITSEGFKHAGKEINNSITTIRTISSLLINTKEYYYIGDEEFFVYQDIIEYKTEKAALKAAELLSSADYQIHNGKLPHNTEAAYTTYEDMIAVIDNTVYRITIITQDNTLRPAADDLLQIISSKN